MVLITHEDAAVGEDDLRPHQVVGGDPVLPPQDPETAAERQARHAHGRTCAGRDGEAVALKGVVHHAEPRAGSHGREAAGHRHRTHGAHVDDDPPRGGMPGEAMAAAPDRHVQTMPAGERDRLGGVLGGRAHDERLRRHLVEPSVERSPRCFIRRRTREATSPAITRWSDPQSSMTHPIMPPGHPSRPRTHAGIGLYLARLLEPRTSRDQVLIRPPRVGGQLGPVDRRRASDPRIASTA